MNIDSKIYVAGHKGMVGSAIWRILEKQGYKILIGFSHQQLDLTNQQAVNSLFEREKPEYVFLAAAKVGGILANNKYRADFIYTNLAIQNNIIYAAFKYSVKKLLFLGSSCIYPKECPQPIKEEYLMTGPLEQTNEPYAIAKIAGLKLCESFNRQYGTNFIAAMPCNLYGPNDNFDLETSHVLPALIRKFIDAKRNRDSHVTIWGTGKVRREFLYVDDAAEACVLLMQQEVIINDTEKGMCHFNIGAGYDVTIAELANMIKEIVGYNGELKFDFTKPDGTYQKLLDIKRLSEHHWRSKIPLAEGIKRTVDWYTQTG